MDQNIYSSMGIIGLVKNRRVNMFEKKTKKIQLEGHEIKCCQCHKTFSKCYLKEEDEESFKDMYIMCPKCFVEYIEEYRKGK